MKSKVLEQIKEMITDEEHQQFSEDQNITLEESVTEFGLSGTDFYMPFPAKEIVFLMEGESRL